MLGEQRPEDACQPQGLWMTPGCPNLSEGLCLRWDSWVTFSHPLTDSSISRKHDRGRQAADKSHSGTLGVAGAGWTWLGEPLSEHKLPQGAPDCKIRISGWLRWHFPTYLWFYQNYSDVYQILEMNNKGMKEVNVNNNVSTAVGLIRNFT